MRPCRAKSPPDEELRLLDNYLALEQERFEHRLNTNLEVGRAGQKIDAFLPHADPAVCEMGHSRPGKKTEWVTVHFQLGGRRPHEQSGTTA